MADRHSAALPCWRFAVSVPASSFLYLFPHFRMESTDKLPDYFIPMGPNCPLRPRGAPCHFYFCPFFVVFLYFVRRNTNLPGSSPPILSSEASPPLAARPLGILLCFFLFRQVEKQAYFIRPLCGVASCPIRRSTYAIILRSMSCEIALTKQIVLFSFYTFATDKSHLAPVP